MLTVFLVIDIKHNLRGAENVACIVEGERDTRGDGEGNLIPDVDESAQTGFGILLGVDDFRHLAAAAFACAHLVEELAVAFLDAGGVCQHNLAEVACGMCAVHEALEPLLDQIREVA